MRPLVPQSSATGMHVITTKGGFRRVQIGFRVYEETGVAVQVKGGKLHGLACKLWDLLTFTVHQKIAQKAINRKQSWGLV